MCRVDKYALLPSLGFRMHGYIDHDTRSRRAVRVVVQINQFEPECQTPKRFGHDSVVTAWWMDGLATLHALFS